jgi:hypothetical protein
MKQSEKDALLQGLAANPHVVSDLVGTLRRIITALPCTERKAKAKAKAKPKA